MSTAEALPDTSIDVGNSKPPPSPALAAPRRKTWYTVEDILRAIRAARNLIFRKGEEEEEKLPPAPFCLALLCLLLAILNVHVRWRSQSERAPVVPSVYNASHPRPLFDIPSREIFRQHGFRPLGLHLYVHYSAYRLSSRSFIGLGLLARDLVPLAYQQMRTCTWQPLGAGGGGQEAQAVTGSVRLVEDQEHHDLAYRVLLVYCTLDEDVPSTAAGGAGGTLYLETEEGARKFLYREDKGSAPEIASEQDPGPFAHNVSHCSAPMYGKLHAGRVAQWVHVHYIFGIDYFLIFDAGSYDDEMKKALEPFTDAGVMDIVNFRAIQNYPVYLAGQLLAVNDCIYRMRPLTRWLLYCDFDEYLWVDKPYSSFLDLLSKHEDKPYITHGVLWYDTKQCLPSAGDQDTRWPTERMLWHWPMFWCMDSTKFPDESMCLNYWGHRKLVVNPRQVRHVENHICMDPEGAGVDLPAQQFRHNHFQGLVFPKAEGQCNTTRLNEELVVWWAHTLDQANAVKEARSTALDFRHLRQVQQRWQNFVQDARSKAGALA